MRKLALLAILFMTPTPTTVGFNESVSYESPKIGLIRRPLAGGGGCYFQFPKDFNKRNNSYVFVQIWRNEPGDDAQINVNGKDLMLKLIRQTEEDFQMKVGYRHFEVYVSGKTRVRVDYVVQGVCPPNVENCSVIVESAVITVHHKGGANRVKAVGLCGS